MRRTILPPTAGQKFGKLTVLEPADPGPRGHAQSRCRCSCGNVVVVANSRLLSEQLAAFINAHLIAKAKKPKETTDVPD